MRKFCFAMLSASLLSCSSFSQETISKITHSYFRSDPFGSAFSSFINHLLNDPSLTDKILDKKTDTSLFYFQGTYTNHNPFFFKPVKVEVILAETALELDSLHTDTIYTYQLLAYNNDTKEGVQELKREFEKIYRRYKGSFSTSKYTESAAGSETNGATYNFFDPFHAVSPFALTWFGPDENREICLILTIRMKISNNEAVLPVPFYAPQ
jgi:hypothetical protein